MPIYPNDKFSFFFFFLKSIEFELPEESMKLLDKLHNDYRVIKLEDMQEKIDKDMPDGYKMKLFHCSLPDMDDQQKV